MKTETPFCDAIKWEMLTFEKQHGEKPKTLVMTTTMAEKLWIEHLPFIRKEEGINFENPVNGYRRFMGMDLVVCNQIYGGDFKWAFGD